MKLEVFRREIITLTFSLILFGTTGCGGGGGGGGDSSPPPQQTTTPPPQPQAPPPDNAPAAVSGRVLQLSSGTATREIRFAASGNTYNELANGTEVQSGSYQYTKSGAGSAATLVMQENNGPVTISLMFGNPTAGNFTYTQGRSGAGTFTLQTAPSGGTIGGTTGETTSNTTGETTGNTTGNTTGETTGNTNGETNGGSTNGGSTGGLSYASLAGRTMLGTRTFTSTGPSGQTHTYTFSQSTFHDSDPPEETDGLYAYTPTGDTAVLILNYTSPAEFAGDRHDLQLNFQEVGRGTFTSQYTREDGTLITINGTFEFP